jgi:hypothetical protein
MIPIGVAGSCEQIAERNYVYESVRLGMVDRRAGCGESVKRSPCEKRLGNSKIFSRAPIISLLRCDALQLATPRSDSNTVKIRQKCLLT